MRYFRPPVRLLAFSALLALLLLAYSERPASADAPRPAACWLLDSPQTAYVSAGGLALLQQRCAGSQAQQVAPQSVPPAGDAGPRAAPLSAGADIRINDPSTDQPPVSTQNETTIAVCDDTALAAWNDSASAFSGAFTGYGRSIDGGASWTDGGFVPGLTGSDPVMAADRNCRFYFSTITWLNGCIVIGVSRSDNLGVSWRPVANASPGVPCQNFQDKEWIAVDNTAGPYGDNVYACWDDRGEKEIRLLFSRSTDGGQSFSPPIVIDRFFFGFATGCHIAVGPGGDVHVVWTHAENLAVFSRTSSNGGVSFSNASLISDTDMIGQFKLCSNNELRPVLNGDMRTFNWPALAVNPLNGHLHVVWNSASSGAADVFYARSADGGASWTAPVRLNDDATGTDQFQPALAFTKSGVLRAIWYDRRLDPDNNYLIDVYSTTSIDDGATFAPNERMTDVSFSVPPLDPNFDPVASTCYMGDYIGIAGGQEDHFMVWGDNRNIVDGHPDPDVYFERRSASGLALTVTRLDDPDPDGCTPTDCSLREAVIASNASPGVDTILLSAGGYALTRAGSGEDLSATGDLDLLGGVVINGVGAADTTVDGQQIDRVFHILATASVDISGFTVRGGRTVDSLGAGTDGGGMFNEGSLNANRMTIAGNDSAGNGGGISNQGIMSVDNSAVYDNSATAGGGGIFNGVTLTANNSTIAQNASDQGSGGGLANAGSATLRQVTLSSNSAGGGGTGGNVRNELLSLVELVNSIVAAGQGGNCSGAITSLGHNLEDANDCLFAAPGDLTNAAPLLGPLGDNRGPTPTNALLPDSPAIDAADGGVCLSADQRGFIRPVDGGAAAGTAAAGGPACDIGAYEFGSRPLGDVDCDFDMDSVDALFLLRLVALLQPFALCVALAGDANCDGARDSLDALAILRRVARLLVQQQANCPPLGLS